MPIKLSELITKRERSIPVQMSGGDSITIKYRPDLYTRVVEAELAEANAAQKVAGGAFGFVRHMVVGWDLLDDDGKPLEITDESVERIGFPIAKAIGDAINRDFVADATKKG